MYCMFQLVVLYQVCLYIGSKDKGARKHELYLVVYHILLVFGRCLLWRVTIVFVG